MTPAHTESDFADLERAMGRLAVPLGRPRPGEWLAHHYERGQTFAQYRKARPVRRSAELGTIYLCLIGEFHGPYERLAADIADYLRLAFDVPVKVHARVPLSEIPARARRTHLGAKQLLTTFILETLLEAHRPPDALAYLGFTVRDLWPGSGWNFVFGEARLRERVGVFSVSRYGYPGPDGAAYTRCLRRAVQVAAHELGHVLTMQHCTAAKCLMNGSNSLAESDSQPLAPCPVCLRKFCWNLQTDPAPYLRRLEAFCRTHAFRDADTFAKMASALEQ